MAKPHEHFFASFCVAKIAQKLGFSIRPWVFILCGILPDIDFLLLVPFLGRPKGHRTITHAPLAHLMLAWLFRPFGFGSVFFGLLLHSIIDNMTFGLPNGIAWLWPFSIKRIHVGGIILDKKAQQKALKKRSYTLALDEGKKEI